MWRKGNPPTLLVGMQTGAATMESSMEVPQKTKNRATICPAIPLLGIYLEKDENSNLKRYRHSNVHSSTIYNSQDMETTQVPINR